MERAGTVSHPEPDNGPICKPVVWETEVLAVRESRPAFFCAVSEEGNSAACLPALPRLIRVLMLSNISPVTDGSIRDKAISHAGPCSTRHSCL